MSGPETLPSHRAFDGRAVRYTVEARPAGADDETATGQTIAAMYDYSTADATDAQVQAVAAECTAGRRDQAQQLAGMFDWLRSNLRYVEDKSLAYFRPNPDDAEVLIRPADLVRMQHPQGDCDEYSMCARAFMLACGIPADFVTVEADEDAPGAYSHVYVIAYSDRGQVPFDAIPATRHGLGYQVIPTGKRRVWTAPRATMLRTTTQAAPGRPATAYTKLSRAAAGVLTPEVLQAARKGSLGSVTLPAAAIAAARGIVARHFPQLPAAAIEYAASYLLNHGAGGPLVPSRSLIAPTYSAGNFKLNAHALNPGTLGALGDDANTTSLDFPFLDTSSSGDSGGSGFDWQDFSTSILKDASGILGTRYGVPQLNPGQVIKRADGTILYQAAPGQTSSPFGSNLFGSGGSSGLMILAALGIGIALIASKR